MTTTDDGLKVFLMTAQLIEEDLDELEHHLALDLGRQRNAGTGEATDYYPQIEHAFRAEAKNMAPHYEVFYSPTTQVGLRIRVGSEGVREPHTFACCVIDPSGGNGIPYYMDGWSTLSVEQGV